MEYKLNTEAEVIDLVGYETIFDFFSLTDGIISYHSDEWELELFLKTDVSRNVFRFEDSFSENLIDYQIFQLTESETDEVLYHRKWVDDFDSNQTNLGLFLNRVGAKDRFDDNVKKYNRNQSLRELYKREDWVLALSDGFPFHQTGEESESWHKVLDLAIEEQKKQEKYQQL